MSSISAGTTSTTTLIHSGDTTGSLVFKTNDTGSGGTTAVTIDTSQRAAFVAGTAALPAITTSGDTNTGIYFPAADTIAFAEGGTEAMRIDSSGNLLVGTSSAGGSRMVVNGATGGTAVLAAVNSTGSGNQFGISSSLGSTANNTNSAHFQGGTAGAGNWYLLGNGTTTYTSDQRLKKNIETTRDGYLADICRLRVVKYNWRNDAEGTDKELGLIAQEVEQVFPRLVQDDLNKISPDDETFYKTLKGSVIPYMLLKAIQELKAINDTQAETINALTARVVALEGQ